MDTRELGPARCGPPHWPVLPPPRIKYPMVSLLNQLIFTARKMNYGLESNQIVFVLLPCLSGSGLDTYRKSICFKQRQAVIRPQLLYRNLMEII